MGGGLGFFSPVDGEAMFANIPEGNNLYTSYVREMLDKMDGELQRIIDKASYDARYSKIAAVISDLKGKIAESKETFLGDFKNKQFVSTSDFNDFLIQTLFAINQAIETKEPEMHRGLFRGTPILRELTMLVMAILRLIMFIFQKTYKYMRSDNTPVYSNGLFQGLFKPAPTRTLKNLNEMKKVLGHEVALAKIHVEGTLPGGKSASLVNTNFDFDTSCFHMRR